MSLEFLTVFHIFDLSFQVARTLQNLDLKLQSYLHFFFFFFFLKYGNYSLWFIMKNQKQSFTRVAKIAVEIFCKIRRKTREQESNFNRLSYLKPTILLKKRLQQRCLAVSFSKLFRRAVFNNISEWPRLVLCKHK